MAITPIKVLLFLLGGTVAAGGTAYWSGMFDGLGRTAVAGGTDPAAKGDRTVASAPPSDAAKAADPATTEPPATAADPAAPADATKPAEADPAQPPAMAADPPETTLAEPPAMAANPPVAEPPPAAIKPPATAANPAAPVDTTQPPQMAALEPPTAKPDPAKPGVMPPQGQPATDAAPAQPGVQPPSFDLMRVEADGSIVIAGHAAANAKVEAVIGSRIIGAATAGPEGDFAIVLDEPLRPGDYQIVLRATGADGVVAMSQETAVVSIPETSDGQVLALVQAPGKAAELITVPQPEKAPPTLSAAEPAPADTVKPPATIAETPAGTPVAPGTDVGAADEPAGPAETDTKTPSDAGNPADQQVASAPASAPADATPPAQAAEDVKIAVEAVEIEGRRIFIAGMADAGVRVRAYANDILLGESLTSQAKRFLIEAERDLPVGDYIIRVDALAADGVKVTARAAVPFQREPGENLAAVAPPAPSEAPKTEKPADDGKMAAADGAVDPAKAQPPAVADDPAKPAEPKAPAEAAAPNATAPVAPGADTVDAGSPAYATPAPGSDAAPATATPTATGSAAATPPAGEIPAEDMAAAQPPASAGAPADANVAAAPAVPPATDADAPPSAGETPAAPPPADPAAAQAPPVPANPVAPPAADMAAAEPPSSGNVAEPGEILAPKLQAVNGSVIIRRGDSLWRISRRVYGRGVRYSTIYLANQPQISDPNRIYPGQVFGVPVKTTEGEDADMEKLGEQAVQAAPGTPATTQQ